MRAPPLLAVVILAAVAFAGCSYDTHRPDGEDGQGGDDGPTAEPEGDSGVLQVLFEATGPTTLEVPFPTLDSCRSPEDWLAGEPTVQGARQELRNASGDRTGRVLALTAVGSGSVSWMVQIPLGPACQTLRYDPWSIDPDPEADTVEVRATEGQASTVSVLVRRVRDGIGEATNYEGNATTGTWTALQGRTVPIGQA
jgi:hypothetical protein